MVLIMNVTVMDRGTLQKYLYGNFPYQDTAVISFYGDNDEKNITEDPKEWCKNQ